MPAVCFPNPDALRLALASGIVPPEVAREPVRAGTDEHGRVWVELADGFPKDALAALGRIGVTRHGPGTGPPTRTFTRWAELLPLRPATLIVGRPVMVELPDGELTRVAAEVRRVRPQRLGVRLLPDVDRAWLLVRDPPLFTLEHLIGSGTGVFAEQAPRVWVAAGWEHPLERHLAAPAGSAALLRPGREWEFVPDEPFRFDPDDFPLTGRTRLRVGPSSDTLLSATLRLRPTDRRGGPETLWVLPGEPTERLALLAGDTDERLLGRFEVAAVRGADGSALTLIRATDGKGRPPILVPAGGGFAAAPQVAGVYLPVGYRMAPPVRPPTLARLLGLDPDALVWLEPATGGRFHVHRAPESAFRPVSEFVSYRAPPAVPLTAPGPGRNPFVPARFTLAPERPSEPSRPPGSGPLPFPTRSGDAAGWFSRSIGRLAGRLLKGSGGVRQPARRKPAPAAAAEPTGRVGSKLSSPDILLLGNEWSARRAALEQRVLTDLPRLPPADRAEVWADLAEVYAAIGNPSDAAVCWLNAAWDVEPVPLTWLTGWLRAEAKAARLAADELDPDVILYGPPPGQAARVAAAYVTWAAALSVPPAELMARLPAVLGLIEGQEADLPARAVWLARVSAARLTDGDSLGLARCRDRVFRRLVEQGPGLDLDAPSFLRFRGGAAGDRFQTARDWLVGRRDPVHRWLGRLTRAGRLQWAGIDPEVGCTAAYADLMLAWGLSKLGDRTRAKELEGQAEATLTRSAGTGVDPGVHRVLLAAFADRIRTAQDGRTDRPGLPLEAAVELARLDDLGRYAVDKLRAHAGILEPIDRVNPYRGRDLGGFLGRDHLGDRLGRLLARPDLAPDPAEVRGLLSRAAADPTAATLPRVVFALLELAPRLDPATVAEVIPGAARAVDLIPEWVRAGVETTDPAGIERQFAGRILSAACHAAGLFHLGDALRQAAGAVADACGTPDSLVVSAVEQSADRLFRTLRRLGLTDSATALLAALDDRDAAGTRELGLAVGWFAAGNEEVGNRILNAARDRLFFKKIGDLRERTAVAIGYATALGHAPPRLALGRLEEIFHELDAIATHGATNRYYTLKPLELIDAVVRAVVSDDFALGPGVRGWLDDDEFLIRKRVTRDLEAELA